MEQEQHHLLRLHLSAGIGRTALFKLHQHFGSFASAVAAAGRDWQQAGVSSKLYQNLIVDTDQTFAAAQKQIETHDIRLVSYWDADYPPLLRTIHDPPALFYLRGTLPTSDCFAIVGSRKATSGGISFTRNLAAQLAEQGICIVSGMARGVDSAAHQGALAANGNTIAVLGCGVDYIYPAENRRLYQDMLKNNAVISEYPPGTLPAAHNFPGRNRIISGLSRGVLIVEAAGGSGSLITADFALEQGRDLFATPGAIHHPNSRGPHQLLKDGAQLVTDSDDILLALWPHKRGGKPRKPVVEKVEPLAEPAATVYRQLGETPIHHDEIARKCALTPMTLSAILLDLELRGTIRQLPGSRYIRSSN